MKKVLIAASSPIKWKIGAETIKWYQGGTDYSHILIIEDRIIFHSHKSGCDVDLLSRFLLENKIVFVMEVPYESINWKFVEDNVTKDTGYGFVQIIKIALKYLFKFRFKSNGNKRLHCSEFVGKALNIPWVDDYTDPQDIVEYLKARAKQK